MSDDSDEEMQTSWERAEEAIERLVELAEAGQPGAAKLMRLVADFRMLANDLSQREGVRVLDEYMLTILLVLELWAASPPASTARPDHFVDRARALCADLMQLPVNDDDGRYDGQRIEELQTEARSLLTGEPRGS